MTCLKYTPGILYITEIDKICSRLSSPKSLEESESVEIRGITVETKNEPVVAEQSY
jgi:hypothetical protein